MSIRARIFLSFTLLLTVSFYYLTNGILNDLKPRYREAIEESQIDLAVVLANLLAEHTAAGRIDTALFEKVYDRTRQQKFSATIYSLVKERVDFRTYVTNQQGIVIFDSENPQVVGQDYSQWRDVLLTLQGEYGARTTRDQPDDLTTTVLYVAAPIRVDGKIIGSLTVGKPTLNSNIFIENASRKILWGTLTVGAFVLLLAVATAALITRPIQLLTEYARGIRDGRRVTLPDLGRSEIGVLGAAFEEMRETLEGKRYVERYVQTLTHEIKSPLSAIQGAAELLDEDMPVETRRMFLTNVRNEVSRIRDLIDKLLQLSALESRRDLQEVTEIDLTRMIREDILPSLAGAYERRSIQIDYAGDGAAKVRGERFLLRQAIVNLLQNAIDFSPSGGKITLRTAQSPGITSVIVEDCGPGIPDYARDRIFERFYSLARPDTGRKSSGLGLSLVKEVAELHGGECRIEPRAEGGTRAIFSIREASFT